MLSEDERKYELKINEYEREIAWNNELDRLPNDPVSGSHKLVMRHIRQIIKRLRYDETTFVQIHNQELVNRTGLDDSTVKRALADLLAWGWVKKQSRRYNIANGEIRTERYLALTGSLVVSFQDVMIPAKKGRGGPRCAKCGSENLVTVKVCSKCGHIHVL